jgi:tellurite resistance protein TerC
MIIWLLFLTAIVLFLALDLGVFNKTPHVIKPKEASLWTGIWVITSFLFSILVYWIYKNNLISNPTSLKPHEATLKYISGYLIELSLSVDNIFIMAIIFASFKIAQKYQHRILFWGILGAILFRGLMIFFGVILIHKFHWMTYLFGAFLIYTAIKMLFKKEEDEVEFNPKKSFVYKILRKIIPITNHTEGGHFFVKRKHVTAATSLFVALMVIEVMDIVFALDSVPAILAITSDPFIVFSSNIFAILGLRSMYFFLAHLLEKFKYLEYSLVAILCFVGCKMVFANWCKIPDWISLCIIGLSLLTGICISIKKRN